MNITDSILPPGNPQSPAVLNDKRTLAYSDLRQTVVSLSCDFVGRGFKKGDRIGLWGENSAFWIIAYLATIRAGLVVVPFQTEIIEERFEKIVRQADMKAVLVSKRFLSKVSPWAQRLGVQVISEAEAMATQPDHSVEMPSINPDTDLAALMFTSGSTGEPKGVMVTHRNIESNTRDIISYMNLTSQDRVMAVLPFHYCFGASLLHTHLMVGGSIVINNSFKLFPESMLQDMQKTECTGLAGVPSTYQFLLRKSRFRKLEFPKLRWLQQAGGRLPTACINEIRESFPKVSFYTMYGQTEATARLSFLPPDRLQDKLGSIGNGLPSTKLQVLKTDGTPVQPGSDETGEIVARGPNISPGYWRDPMESASVFKNGALHTGDIARVDSDGFIFIVDRERDFIKSGGHRVSAREIEEAIAEIPDVVEVAVIGTPHDLLGESIEAYIVRAFQSGLSEEQVRAHCTKRLSGFKVPEAVHFLGAMPHNSAGKTVKGELKELAALRRASVLNGGSSSRVLNRVDNRAGIR